MHSFSGRGLNWRNFPSSPSLSEISSAGLCFRLCTIFPCSCIGKCICCHGTAAAAVCWVHRDVSCAHCPHRIPSDSNAIALHLFQMAEYDVERVRGMQLVPGHNQLSLLYPACFNLCIQQREAFNALAFKKHCSRKRTGLLKSSVQKPTVSTKPSACRGHTGKQEASPCTVSCGSAKQQ